MHKLKISQTVHKTSTKIYLKKKKKTYVSQVKRTYQWNFTCIIWIKEDFKGIFVL